MSHLKELKFTPSENEHLQQHTNEQFSNKQEKNLLYKIRKLLTYGNSRYRRQFAAFKVLENVHEILALKIAFQFFFFKNKLKKCTGITQLNIKQNITSLFCR